MKQSIKWHIDCQVNVHISILMKRKLIDNMQKDLDIMESDYKFKQTQIEEAFKQNKKGFDAYRFMNPRKQDVDDAIGETSNK